MNHLSDSNVVHSPVKLLTPSEVVPFIETEELASSFLNSLQEEVAQEVLSRGDEFIKKLVEAMMAPPTALSEWTRRANAVQGYSPSISGVGERICRKHKHQGWCNRMYVLDKYIRLAVNYHHARKRLRWEGADKYMSLVVLYGSLKAEARAKFYSADCTCHGLGNNDEFQSFMHDAEFEAFIHEYKR